MSACAPCAANDHDSCDGTAWDDHTDNVTSCGCELEGHPEGNDERP